MAGEQGWIKVNQGTKANRRRWLNMVPSITKATDNSAGLPLGPMPVDGYITNVMYMPTTTHATNPVTFTIGLAGSVAAYATMAAAGATQAAGTVVNVATLTNTLVNKGTVLVGAAAASAGAGVGIFMIEIEPFETNEI